ncbi:cobalt-nickel-resistance system protein [Anaeromyxobacter oryzae]|uniref:Cobalt-nickel-resistance system protein n=2 Tax=Anaeromyxobacter oryzae TaxID=2918170 RepID=A0ABM7WSB1_9BACT|nr:cobalt-nickel-resistance system protein [Anaeromyxobacter oryzae]
MTGLAAAALFGASTPFAKLLVPGTGPLTLAGLLYLGAAAGLLAAAPLRRSGAEAPIQRSDLPVLALVVVAGGVVGPILLVVGLARLSGASAALLLNLEAPFTIALAVVMLGEHLARREVLGAAVVILGAAALTWAPGALQASPAGAASIAGACAAWAVDNNLSQRLSIRDPVAVARAKTLAAGAFDVALGLALGERLPPAAHVAAALLTGALGYGLSIVLHLLAVRALGAARQAAYFATAPFIGALLAIPLLHDRLSPAHLAAGALMALGIALIVRTRHAHAHTHDAEEHEHAHVHDEHHAHAHAEPVVEPHSHPHRHAQLFHDHPHAPDLHHRHGH